MKYLDKIIDKFKIDEERKNCPLNPFLRSYYDDMKPEYYDEAMKNIRYTIRDNKIFIKFLKVKIQENKSCTDWYNTSRFEDLLKREILEKEYIYKMVNSYEIEKNGYAHILRNAEKTTLTLITCKHNTNKQLIVICELVEIK